MFPVGQIKVSYQSNMTNYSGSKFVHKATKEPSIFLLCGLLCGIISKSVKPLYLFCVPKHTFNSRKIAYTKPQNINHYIICTSPVNHLFQHSARNCTIVYELFYLFILKMNIQRGISDIVYKYECVNVSFDVGLKV